MSGDGSPMRLQKYLSRAGVASRREAETWMAQGRVRVNGEVAVTPGIQVTPGRDRVEVDGREVHLSEFRWIALNKPLGTVTTRKDPQGRPTVYTLLPPEHRSLPYVGRLDLLTEGLLLFTNEGDAMHGLLHPSSEVSREYRARVQGVPAEATLRRLEVGVELDDGPARAELVRHLKGAATRRDEAVLSLVLREGRKHEVRRLLETVGHRVVSLERTAFGPLRLGNLPRGEWRELTSEEISALRVAAGVKPEPSSRAKGGSGSGRGSGRKIRPGEKPNRPRPPGGRSGTR
ncbi:MAG: rRNA pseudouridine synthase [Gemmatimonadales bacterium]|nr:MAG: rRNA pseudouridine synthase [Gemmatimonadales bacterium]